METTVLRKQLRATHTQILIDKNDLIEIKKNNPWWHNLQADNQLTKFNTTQPNFVCFFLCKK